jgi:hypothetical protein
MTIHRFQLVMFHENTLYRMNWTGTRAGLPEGWSIHKRSAAL